MPPTLIASIPIARRILIADDDAGMARALTIRLEREGYSVISATDAYHALDRAVKTRPDLLVLDINMPAGDGFSVLERMGRIPGMTRTPVLFITGAADPAFVTRARQMGASLLRKPFPTHVFLGKVLECLRNADDIADDADNADHTDNTDAL